jgi:iron complex transport system permease protein
MRPRLTHLALLLLPAALLLALGTGPGAVGLGEALASVLGHVGAQLGVGDPPGGLRDAIVWQLRLPRALLAGLVGAALACAGALTQGLFRNPLADPGVLGVSAGAMLAAVIGFMFGAEGAGLWVTPLLAAGGAGLVLLVLLGLHRAQQSLATLLLSGFALGTLCAALATLCLALGAQRWDLGIRVMQWSLGSFEGRTWIHLAWALTPCVGGLALAAWLRRDLDTLHLGHDIAASLGVDLAQLRRRSVLAVGLLVGAATALSGVIGFVGLLVPHLARMLAGPGHRRMLPHAALLGAALLMLVDTLARNVTTVVLPPGVLTSLLGAPLFLWLLRRRGLAEI